MTLLKGLGALVVSCFAIGAQAQIQVESATYGANCGAWRGNATSEVRWQCDGQQVCDYYISVSRLGDPAPGCPKNFDVRYRCGFGGQTKHETVFQEANGGIARLDCSFNNGNSWGINILEATYGGNVGARSGNVTSAVERVCGGRSSCRYYVSTQEIGDPAPGRTKDFYVEYSCGGRGRVQREHIRAEANGNFIDLRCR